jgi:hypothetical protein
VTDRDLDTLTLLLMDPFLTRDEAEREAAALETRPAAPPRPAQAADFASASIRRCISSGDTSST